MIKWYKNDGMIEKIVIFDEKENIVNVLYLENEFFYYFLSCLINKMEYLFLILEVEIYIILKFFLVKYLFMYLGFIEMNEMLDNFEKEIGYFDVFVVFLLKKYYDMIEKMGFCINIYYVFEELFICKCFVDKLID